MNKLQMMEETDRQKFLGGSDIAAIFGVSPFKTPLDLYMDKIKPRSEKEDLNEQRRKFFARRKAQEPIIAGMLKEEYGLDITRLSMDENPNRYRDSEFPFLASEIDFEFRMNNAVKEHFYEDRPEFCELPNGIILNGEIKTVHPFKAFEWGEQGSEEIPLYYAAQIMFGMGITRRPAALCAALFGLDNLMCFPVMADQETIQAMRDKAVDFWINHVQAQIPPDPLNLDDVKKLYAKTLGKEAKIDQATRDKIIEVAAMKAKKKTLDDGIEILQNDIAMAVWRAWGLPVDGEEKPDPKDSALLTFDGKPVATWNLQRGSSLDRKRLAADKPEIIKEYTRVYHHRVLRVKKEALK